MNEKIIQRLQFHNPWWQTGKISPKLALPYKRRAFFKIRFWLSKIKRIIVLKGPRRTGKTTILYQLMEKFLKEGINPQNLLYLPFDDPDLRISLRELLEIYEQTRVRDLSSLPETFIFLDEVPFLPHWESEVKLIFDKNMPVSFFVSGSSSSLIRKSTESLAGRTIEKVLLPFSFAEFVEKEYGKEFLERKGLLKNKKQLYLFWGRYLQEGGFPQLIGLSSEEKIEILKNDIIDKVIYKDLTQLYNIREPLSLEKLFRFLIENTAGIVNISELGGFLGLSRETVQNYLFYLKEAYLVFTLPKYSFSSKEIIRSLEKIHLIDQSFSFIYPAAQDEAILESVVARHLWEKQPRNTYYWRYKYEVDIVFEEKGELEVIEVKRSKKISPNSLRGLLNFCHRFSLNKAKVLYYGEKKREKREGIKISFVPVYEYLLAE